MREKVPLYFWRFLNPDRASILDIDTDVQSFSDLPQNTPVKRVDETQAARHLDLREL